jgi:hypothetical protein
MSLIKRGADLVYTFRFIRMLVMKWENWDAAKLGIIDENGKRQKDVKLDTAEKKAAYTPFIRLAANIKRLLSKIPGGGSKLGSFAAGLFLIKEKFDLSDTQLDKIMREVGIDTLDVLEESSQWFILEDGTLSEGIYRVYNHKILNSTYEEIVLPKDQVKVTDGSPVGDVFGMNIFEATHVKTGQKVYISANEIYK